jgi:hypothetical protein
MFMDYKDLTNQLEPCRLAHKIESFGDCDFDVLELHKWYENHIKSKQCRHLLPFCINVVSLNWSVPIITRENA